MQSSRFHQLTARFSPMNIRTSFRRSSSASSSSRGSTDRHSYMSSASSVSPATTINSIILRQKSIVDMEEERKNFSSELSLLEPRPVVYWGSVEERMGSF
ncbi:hypothetical protein GQ53DRAFT_825411 [Thozetella sp. PMI_491]|nr:hypothetical protein GQ53DRAFT_825411 [Thozetella sp. PMI_491]